MHSYVNCESGCSGGGEGQEFAIIAFFIDLLDEYNADETYDTLEYSHQVIWNKLNSLNTILETFSQFYNIFKDNKLITEVGEIGKILEVLEFSSKNINTTDTLQYSVPPTFYWVAGGGYNMNNYFILYFLDSSSNLIFSTSTNATSYELSINEWCSILNTNGSKFKIIIASAQTFTPSTGYYYSKIYEFNIPIAINPSENITFFANRRYVERRLEIYPGQYYEYVVNFESNGEKLLQTFGTADAIIDIYNSNNVLLYSNDDNGYSSNALKHIDTIANSTYRIRVYLYNQTQYAIIRFSITVSDASYYDYTEINECFNVSSVTQELGYYEASLNRYTPTVSCTVDFIVNADFDSYIYIIDPRSNELISSSSTAPSCYNDDGGGNLQARIIKTLEANVSYLIIVCAYNPSNQCGELILYFN